MTEYEYRTAVTKLEVTSEQRERLESTIDEWRTACNIASNMAWPETSASTAVQQLAYDRIRSETILCSQHAILAAHRAAEAIRSEIARAENGWSVSQPEFTAPTVTYDARTMTVFEDETVSLSTVRDRIRCRLALPDDQDGYQWKFLDDPAWELTESTLHIRRGEFYLHLGFRRQKEDEVTAENDTVLGVDLGVENIAVTSTAQFFPGKELVHERNQFERRRGSLQTCGTRSAGRTIRSVALRERRYLRNEIHRFARRIVDEAQQFDCGVIAIEDLEGIQRRIDEAGWFHLWAFRRLREYITYKAETTGIVVESVNPAGTSITCSDCGHEAAENRLTREMFVCSECGTQANADYNAAKNIALEYVRSDPQSSDRTGTRQCALKSGTVTAEGSFQPYGSRTSSAR